VKSTDENLNAVLGCLPHGPEFRFLDRLTSLVPGKRSSGQYKVKTNDLFLRGHFPGNPLFPGVLLIEAAAQLAGTVAQSDPEHPTLNDLRLTALNRIKILGSATPGQTIELEALVSGRLGNLIQASVKASVEGRVLLEGELTLSGTAPRG
jgi:3-hydroxyacyl-[acyl-carrier-protein] dehydratase